MREGRGAEGGEWREGGGRERRILDGRRCFKKRSRLNRKETKTKTNSKHVNLKEIPLCIRKTNSS